jgi:hypothetical protein
MSGCGGDSSPTAPTLNATVFPVGTSAVTFPFWNASNSIGTADSTVTVTLPLQFPAGGQFVIGDLAPHLAGDRVNFWGAQWATNNPMSGGSVPNAFKGFENGTAPPAFGTWTSRPGNSSNPPATIPESMDVIVSSLVQKNGPVITGDVKEIICLKTEPGYGPAPGHRGYGMVVDVLPCTPSPE